MTTYEATIKIDTVSYTITWDSANRITIPEDLTAVTTADELLRLLQALRAVKTWLDNALKKRVTVKRDD